MSRLLIDEQPVIFSPTLAQIIGLNEAIALQKLHFLTGVYGVEKNGRRWIFNTAEVWNNMHFPFWSLKTVRRTFQSLEALQVVYGTDEYNRSRADRTKWYSPNYDQLAVLEAQFKANSGSAQNGQTSAQNGQASGQIGQASAQNGQLYGSAQNGHVNKREEETKRENKEIKGGLDFGTDPLLDSLVSGTPADAGFQGQPSLSQEPQTPAGESPSSEKQKSKSSGRGGAAKPPAYDALTYPIPDWIPAEIWADWCAHRTQIKHPLTELAAKATVRDLEGLRQKGWDPVNLINRSIANGWRGIIEPNGQPPKPQQQQQAPQNAPRRTFE